MYIRWGHNIYMSIEVQSNPVESKPSRRDRVKKKVSRGLLGMLFALPITGAFLGQIKGELEAREVDHDKNVQIGNLETCRKYILDVGSGERGVTISSMTMPELVLDACGFSQAIGGSNVDTDTLDTINYYMPQGAAVLSGRTEYTISLPAVSDIDAKITDLKEEIGTYGPEGWALGGFAIGLAVPLALAGIVGSIDVLRTES